MNLCPIGQRFFLLEIEYFCNPKIRYEINPEFNKIFVSFLLLLSSIAHAQYIEIEEHYTEEELVKDIFLGTNSAACIDVSNISVKGGNFGTYHKSYGYFNANGSSFPIEEGLILSTGKAESAKGPNSYILQESASNWLGDSDLEDALHISSTHNATILEFDFISHNTNRISFDYMFSSEQYLSYPQSYQCDYTDGFAFLIKKAGSTDRYENIAVIPNTDIPVAVNTIRGRSLNGNCPAQNEQYFGGFNDNDHPTNFNGQTKVLAAQVATEQFVIINLINVITPNGDGYNDELNYEDLKIKNNVTIKVFDRFGNTVHSGNENTLKWDGKSFGKPLPTGTYWYVISWTEPAIGEIKTYHGWVLLKNRN